MQHVLGFEQEIEGDINLDKENNPASTHIDKGMYANYQRGAKRKGCADEKEHKVAELGEFIGPCVPQSDMLKHDSHVHGWV